ncbi:hypothetical protein N7451_009936 [Penicillium sp. IBT 35674x]|nr:hypothetical protein N7451_009936 [Penicillium sp. IBT 35674x]
MSQDDREELQGLISDDGSDLADTEAVVPELFDHIPSLGGLSNREVQELVNSGDEWAIRAYYQTLVIIASIIDYELPEIGLSNDELDILSEELPEGPVTPNPLPTLPATDADQQMIDSGVECAICLNPPELGGRVTTLPCGHLFHYLCITQWLTRSTTCPLCRQDAVPLNQHESINRDDEPHHSDSPPERHVHWAI